MSEHDNDLLETIGFDDRVRLVMASLEGYLVSARATSQLLRATVDHLPHPPANARHQVIAEAVADHVRWAEASLAEAERLYVELPHIDRYADVPLEIAHYVRRCQEPGMYLSAVMGMIQPPQSVESVASTT